MSYRNVSVLYYWKEITIIIDFIFLNLGREIANESLKFGMYGPTNSLWCYFVNNGNTTEAQSMWEILKSSPGAIKFQSICRKIRKANDDDLADTLVKTLMSAENVKPAAFGVAYSAWIDALRNY